jgi:DDE superfamily endonuclease
VPTLSPGEIVVMDSLGSHKRAGVRKAIEAAGATPCLLPAYSPDLDPIEQVFANSPPALSTNPRLLEPEAGFVQKYVAQNGPPNRRCSVGWHRISSRRLPPDRMLQLFPQRRIWLDLIEQCSRPKMSLKTARIGSLRPTQWNRRLQLILECCKVDVLGKYPVEFQIFSGDQLVWCSFAFPILSNLMD